MSRTAWKRREREAAALISGKRYTANQGGFVDCESDAYCVQVKERRTLSLSALESLTVEIERVADQKTKHGIVMVKRSAGRGRPTPWLVVMTAGTFRALNGARPTDEGSTAMVDEKPKPEDEKEPEPEKEEPAKEEVEAP